MIILRNESPRTLNDIAALLGRHPSTVRRWATTGLHGAVLDTLAIGGCAYTSLEALERFANVAGGRPAPPPSDRRRKSAAAARALEEHGV